MSESDRFYTCGFIAGRTALEAEIYRAFALSGGEPITTDKFAELIENVRAPVVAGISG